MTTRDGAYVTAIVLVGGGSRRMGRDKATLVPDDGDPRSLVQRVLDSLAPVAGDAMLLGTHPRPPRGVQVIADQNPGAGPLPALAGALALLEPRGLAVLAACDMPTIVPALVVHLVARARQSPDALCVLCATERGIEPLLSVWRPAAASHLRDALRDGVGSLHVAIARLPHLLLAPDEWRELDPTGESFRNWNTPEDVLS